MPSFVITGANRGIGYAFLTNLAQIPSTTIFALVRDPSDLTSKLAKTTLAGAKNIHIIQADVADRASLQTARDQVSAITNGSLDCLINNAAYLPWEGATTTMASYTEDKIVDLENDLRLAFEVNTLGIVNTSLLFVPLLRKGLMKKVLTLSSGVADFDIVTDLEISEGVPYAISKAAVNMAVLKFHNAFKKEGMLFFAVSPGVVDTGGLGKHENSELPEKFKRYKPDFKGPSMPEESVELMMGLLERATIEEFGGKMVSQFGNKQWL